MGFFCIVFAVGLVSGTFGAIIGSSLLVIVPALVLLGLPAPVALGTGKVSALARDIPALLVFHRSGKVRYGAGLLFTVAGALGTVIGAFMALSIDAATLELLIGIFTVGTGAVLLLRPEVGQTSRQPIRSPRTAAAASVALGLPAGIYAGIFGGGANLLIIFAFIFILGHDFLTAVATSKIPNLVFMVTFTGIFAYYDQIDYWTAVPLVLGMGIGGHYGAKLAVLGGNRFLRFLFVALAAVLAVRMALG
ncbi:MAG: sulfite exporter TauE/SafE family protein [Bdellovibrionales bacterium]|nr:sulfite exporter TauE/SafE family protein [Bdellovibrionales bacterium]